jgi:hypothetical protein
MRKTALGKLEAESEDHIWSKPQNVALYLWSLEGDHTRRKSLLLSTKVPGEAWRLYHKFGIVKIKPIIFPSERVSWCFKNEPLAPLIKIRPGNRQFPLDKIGLLVEFCNSPVTTCSTYSTGSWKVELPGALRKRQTMDSSSHWILNAQKSLSAADSPNLQPSAWWVVSLRCHLVAE